MTLQEFLLYMQGSGVNAIVGVLWSFAVEFLPSFKGLSEKAKRISFLAACMVVPIVGAVLSMALEYQPVNLETTIWYALVAGWVAFTTGTMSHVRKM